MRYYKLMLILVLLVMAGGVWGQDTLAPQNIPTLNRIAGEYDSWKWRFGITAAVLATIMVVWNTLGLKALLKTKVNEWLDQQIAKYAGLKVETLKEAMAEYVRTAELKKKKILVISAGEGQQANVKKVLDNTGFSNCEWENVTKLSSLVLKNVHLLLLNDQPDVPISQSQIDDAIKNFGKNVACLYFGPKHPLPIGDYRKEHPQLNLGLCNSADRLETGILSILKIV